MAKLSMAIAYNPNIISCLNTVLVILLWTFYSRSLMIWCLFVLVSILSFVYSIITDYLDLLYFSWVYIRMNEISLNVFLFEEIFAEIIFIKTWWKISQRCLPQLRNVSSIYFWFISCKGWIYMCILTLA